jgi:hypothetical protein
VSLSVAAGTAAVLVAVLLVLGLGGLLARRRPWRPWLAVLLGINAGRGDVSGDTLRGVVPVDVLLLGLAALTYAGLGAGAGAGRAVWTVPAHR